MINVLICFSALIVYILVAPDKAPKCQVPLWKPKYCITLPWLMYESCPGLHLVKMANRSKSVGILVFCYLLSSLGSSTASAKDNAVQIDEGIRLPRNLLPDSYNIRLLPFIEEGNFTADGHVEIFFRCVTATDSIVVNSAEITIHNHTIKVIITSIRFGDYHGVSFQSNNMNFTRNVIKMNNAGEQHARRKLCGRCGFRRRTEDEADDNGPSV